MLCDNLPQNKIITKNDAKKILSSLENLKKVNNIKGDKILNGQVLEIPRKDVHIVRGGETLYNIGQKYNITAKELRKWNSLVSNKIRPKQEINLQPKTIGMPIFFTALH